MNLEGTAEELSFRVALREWLARNAPPPGNHSIFEVVDLDAQRAWSRTIHEAGYAGITWPGTYGGRGLGPQYQTIYYEETVKAQAPAHIGPIGLNMAGPTILAWGTEEQKRTHLPPMLSADEIWCQGFSEPGSGSDLASGQTSAVLDGEQWVVNGQKIWSSYAHVADKCILLVRTDPTAPKHKGLSYLLVDMASPGVEVRPLRQLTGEPEFNEIFFTDVHVPVDSMLGQPGDGWAVATTTLMHERGTLGFLFGAMLQHNFDRLVELAQRPGPDGSVPADDPVLRAEIAREWANVNALRFTNHRSLKGLLTRGEPGPESSITKVTWAETNQRVTRLGASLMGLATDTDGDFADLNTFWRREQLRSRGNSIEGGTSEVLRNIVAERVLSLPRSR